MKSRTTYHSFKRRMDGDQDTPPFIIRARVRHPRRPVVIRLQESTIVEALKRNGQADGQNCAGAVCTLKHKALFGHPVSGLVDWWRSRVFIAGPPNPKTNKTDCWVYAHYDDVEELFDTEVGLKKLLKRVKEKGYIDITLYPVRNGIHPITGKRQRPSGPGSTSGQHKQPRRVGDELRIFNYTRARQAA